MEISSITQIDDKADKQRKHKTHEVPPVKGGPQVGEQTVQWILLVLGARQIHLW